MFALMLTNKILVSAGKVKNSDVDVLLKGGGALDIASVSVRPLAADYAWLNSSSRWHTL